MKIPFVFTFLALVGSVFGKLTPAKRHARPELPRPYGPSAESSVPASYGIYFPTVSLYSSSSSSPRPSTSSPPPPPPPPPGSSLASPVGPTNHSSSPGSIAPKPSVYSSPQTGSPELPNATSTTTASDTTQLTFAPLPTSIGTYPANSSSTQTFNTTIVIPSVPTGTNEGSSEGSPATATGNLGSSSTPWYGNTTSSAFGTGSAGAGRPSTTVTQRSVSTMTFNTTVHRTTYSPSVSFSGTAPLTTAPVNSTEVSPVAATSSSSFPSSSFSSFYYSSPYYPSPSSTSSTSWTSGVAPLPYGPSSTLYAGPSAYTAYGGRAKRERSGYGWTWSRAWGERGHE